MVTNAAIIDDWVKETALECVSPSILLHERDQSLTFYRKIDSTSPANTRILTFSDILEVHSTALFSQKSGGTCELSFVLYVLFISKQKSQKFAVLPAGVFVSAY